MALYHGHLSFVVPIVDESMRKIFRATGHRFDTDIPIWHLIIDMQAVLIQTKEILWRWPNIGPTNSLGNARTWACYYYTYSRVHSKWCWVSAWKRPSLSGWPLLFGASCQSPSAGHVHGCSFGAGGWGCLQVSQDLWLHFCTAGVKEQGTPWQTQRQDLSMCLSYVSVSCLSTYLIKWEAEQEQNGGREEIREERKSQELVWRFGQHLMAAVIESKNNFLRDISCCNLLIGGDVGK